MIITKFTPESLLNCQENILANPTQILTKDDQIITLLLWPCMMSLRVEFLVWARHPEEHAHQHAKKKICFICFINKA